MARLAHTQNYLLLHPGREQVARQPAMEALPLVMEPRSRLYTDPVVVLDFQVRGRQGAVGGWEDGRGWMDGVGGACSCNACATI